MNDKDEVYKRVCKEFSELSEKVGRLEVLLKDKNKKSLLGISNLQSDLLWAQMRAMVSYQTILAIRIEHWDDE